MRTLRSDMVVVGVGYGGGGFRWKIESNTGEFS